MLDRYLQQHIIISLTNGVRVDDFLEFRRQDGLQGSRRRTAVRRPDGSGGRTEVALTLRSPAK